MADERDPAVSQRYRELGSEEPPAALDDAILAASRRAAGARRRWYLPLAAAAVLVLAVGVALHLQRQPEQPEPATAPLQQEQAPKEAREAAPAAAPMPRTAPPEALRRAETPARGVAADALHERPELLLERIAELRKEGRHDEADKALAQFRQRYPDFGLSEETRAKVERR